ncbi:MAG: flagellin [Firmicutes bacterium]|jgi:flagellin|nr:flagellin [Bacillota bacterium]
MRIQTNVSALNAWRNLNQTSGAMGKNLERLSSGFRINRAADDAAGLAISEKMRAQIRGLNQATRNAQDGISLIQTAEGAMGEIQNILQRMRELANQAASDGMTDADRDKIQKEVDQLAKQITDVANTTQFNTKRILTGEYGGDGAITIQTGANKGEALGFGIAAVDAKSLGVGRAEVAPESTIDKDTNSFIDSSTLSVTGLEAGDYTIKITLVEDGSSGTYKYDSVQLDDGKGGILDGVINGNSVTFEGQLGGAEVTVAFTLNDASSTGASDQTYDVELKVTEKEVADSYVAATEANGWQAKTYGGISISTQQAASDAVKTIDDAINNVSGYRAELGALQNRLEHSIANLQITAENLQAAESRIRDVDMAQEMTQFTRSQILMQSGTAMLAQANMMPQAILKLLG